jgi:ABC-type uncharacterized transport system YnjBCD permease subunit
LLGRSTNWKKENNLEKLMKNFSISHILFIVFILVLAIYLGLKTLPEDGWDDWGFGSAQTLMTMKHWSEDGMIHSKFLFIPIGYFFLFLSVIQKQFVILMSLK